MENDTVRLLRECNAGIKMGEDAIKKVLPHVKDSELKSSLEVCKSTHAALGDETHAELIKNKSDTKDPHPIARAMSSMKISMKLMLHDSDKTVADVMTDGCDMGIKSLTKYLNEYKSADKTSRDIAKKIIASEEYLENKMRSFL